jgi:hypothetical protein
MPKEERRTPMTGPTELPADFNPFTAASASLRADMERAGDYDSLLKRHGLPRAGQFRPYSPWDSLGNLRGTTAPPPGPGAQPTNGGIADARR